MWKLEHTYAQLPALFYTDVQPTPVPAPRMVVFNRKLAAELGLGDDSLAGAEGAQVFAGNQLPPGARPIAQAYAGHQFGHFTTLGDGRAILLGEQVTPRGERFDVQLKGSGPTPYSRRGDGRAALGPMLREYIVSEAMHAFGIPTTRSLAVVATGDPVFRESQLPGAVLTRVAASHIRIGTFEWALASGGVDAVRALVDYTLRRHYPGQANAPVPAQALLDAVIERQAALIAQWMLVGFIHGVMNTDNMVLSGETIDYGPCAFMNVFDPATVFSSIDRAGRYAYGNQPRIALWNLTRLAETLVPLLDETESEGVASATASLEKFGERFQHHWLAGMAKKLGLFNQEADDEKLFRALLDWIYEAKADYTNTFAELSRDIPADDPRRHDAKYMQWHQQWLERLGRQPNPVEDSDALRMSSNPVIIPRNHLVEEALAAAANDDLSVMQRLLDALAHPYDRAGIPREFTQPPAHDPNYRTFCGT